MTQQVFSFYFFFKFPRCSFRSFSRCAPTRRLARSTLLPTRSRQRQGWDHSRPATAPGSTGAKGMPPRRAPHRGCKARCSLRSKTHLHPSRPPRLSLRAPGNPFPVSSSSQGLGSFARAGMQSLKPLPKTNVAGQPASSIAPRSPAARGAAPGRRCRHRSLAGNRRARAAGSGGKGRSSVRLREPCVLRGGPGAPRPSGLPWAAQWRNAGQRRAGFVNAC